MLQTKMVTIGRVICQEVKNVKTDDGRRPIMAIGHLSDSARWPKNPCLFFWRLDFTDRGEYLFTYSEKVLKVQVNFGKKTVLIARGKGQISDLSITVYTALRLGKITSKS